MSFEQQAEYHNAREARIRAEGRGYIVDAHEHTTEHRVELEASQQAGCFYCLFVFSPTDIEEWTDNNDCALCPRCGIDSVIGDASAYPVTEENFLKEMNEFWFNAPNQ